jgi:hypothetical protein
MPITEETHPYRVKIGDKIVAFPASMSMKEVEAACKRIHDEQNSTNKTKPAPVPKSQPKSPKPSSILGADRAASGVAGRLSQILDGVDPATASEKTKADIYTAIISYRRTAKHLPEEERTALDRRIAEYSNSQVKPKPARRKKNPFSVQIKGSNL